MKKFVDGIEQEMTDAEVAEIQAEQSILISDIFPNLHRNRRNDLLAETDWWASSDHTMTSEQTAYRKALRNITTHANWPNLADSDWPTKPE